MVREKDLKSEKPPGRLVANAPKKSEAFIISLTAWSEDSDGPRTREGYSRLEFEDGGLRVSFEKPPVVNDPSRICRPLVLPDEELLARLADPLRIKGRGPLRALLLEGLP